MSKDKAPKKVATVQVEVKRTKKLTLQEINALVDTTANKVNDDIRLHNTTFKDSMQFKADLKAIKTKYGILKAERCLIAFAQRHPKVKFDITASSEFYKEERELSDSYKRKGIDTSNWSSDIKNLRNRLILEQADGAKSVFELAEAIAQEYLTR